MATDRRPLLCLITDRHRLCPGCVPDAARRCLLAQVREAVAAGVDLVQIRERGLDGGALAELVSAAVPLARGSATHIIVNERVDVALACGAAGVHLRSDSASVAAVRRIAPPGFLIGRSVHDADDVPSAAGADYLIAGTVFPSASKPGAERLLGAGGLAELVRATRQPVLAVGGITLERLADVAASGAAGVAAIGLFLGVDSGSPCRSVPFRAIVETARARFDSVKTAP